MIGIFSTSSSDRLNFVLDFIFKDKGQSYKVISNEKNWNSFEGSKLNYSKLNVDCDYSIEPSGILEETQIDQSLKLELDNDQLLLRGFEDKLSIIFYVLSRYEEYQAYEKDEHGRFSASQSQQSKFKLLQKPFLDDYVKYLWLKMDLDYSEVLQRFECVPSFDIDVAWAFKGRPLWRTVGGMLKRRGEGRLKVLLNRQKDPYDTYSDIIEISAKVNRIICFSLLSDWGDYDKNINWKNTDYQSLIRGLNSSGGMGVHPGYNSHLKSDVLKTEIDRLKEIVGHEVEKSRFHFLRFELPKSYELLIENGIKKDYTMGYHDDTGFRAGTSFPFSFFNLNSNKKQDLLIFPFAYMDSALKDNLKFSISEAEIRINELIDRTANVGGLFMCIWHNSSITNLGDWEGWNEVLNSTVNYSSTKLKS